MSRHRVLIPTKHTRRQSEGLVLSPGVRAWLRRWAPTTEIHFANDVYELEFEQIGVMAQFKLNFGIDTDKHAGGFSMTFTKVDRNKYDRMYPLMLEAMTCHPELRYEINSQPWHIGHVPIRFSDSKFDELGIYFEHLVAPLITILRRTLDFEWSLPTLIQYVDELCQSYLPVPVVMITGRGDEIDISNMDPVIIALMQ